MFNGKFVITLALPLIAAGCLMDGDLIKSFEFDEAITHVDVANESGNLCIEPSLTEISIVDFDLTYEGSEPDYEVAVVGSTLYVYLDCHRMCNGDITLRIPADAGLKTDSPAGHVSIRDMESEVVARVYNGNLTAERLSGSPLTLETGFGNLRGAELTSSGAFVQTYVGWINVDFEAEVNGLIARTHSGDIKMTVPSGNYDLYTEIGSGHVNIDGVTYDPSSANYIHVLTTVGNIDILGI